MSGITRPLTMFALLTVAGCASQAPQYPSNPSYPSSSYPTYPQTPSGQPAFGATGSECGEAIARNNRRNNFYNTPQEMASAQGLPLTQNEIRMVQQLDQKLGIPSYGGTQAQQYCRGMFETMNVDLVRSKLILERHCNASSSGAQQSLSDRRDAWLYKVKAACGNH